MKLKSRKIISLALVFFMMLTILPMAPVTAHAAGKTTVNQVTLNGVYLPEEGKPCYIIDSNDVSTPSGSVYTFPGQEDSYYDGENKLSGAETFEAGHKYRVSLRLLIKEEYADTYAFSAENPPEIILDGFNASRYSSFNVSYAVGMEGQYLDVSLDFVMDGEATYAPIDTLVLDEYKAPVNGQWLYQWYDVDNAHKPNHSSRILFKYLKSDGTEYGYYDSSSVKTETGNKYGLLMKFQADENYIFTDTVDISVASGNPTITYEVSADKKILTVKLMEEVPDGDITAINFGLTGGAAVIAGQNAGTIIDANVSESSPDYYVDISLMTGHKWKDENGNDVTKFEAGKKYTGQFDFRAETGHSFAKNPTVNITSGAKYVSHTVKYYNGDYIYLEVTVTPNDPTHPPVTPPATTYTITATAGEGGTVTQTGSGTYSKDDAVTVAAIPNTGYEFVEWQENGVQVSTQAVYSFGVEGNRNLVAVFKAKDVTPPATTCDVLASVFPAKSGTTTGTGRYNTGDSVTVTATAKEGYVFKKWVNVEDPTITLSTNPTYTFTVNENIEVNAIFEKTEGGDVTPPATTCDVLASVFPLNSGTTTGTGRYNAGDSVTVTATANEGYVFKKWVNVEDPTITLSTNPTYTFTANENTEVTAMFEKVEGGELEKTAAPTISYNDTTFTVEANGNGTVVLYVDGTAVANPYTFTQADTAKTYVVTATAQEEGKEISETATLEVTVPAQSATEYDITVTGGTATPAKAAEGTLITLTANAAPAGQVFDKWEVVSGDVTITDNKFTMPANAVEVKATYKDQSYIVTYLVTLEYNNGSEPAKFLVESGATVTKPADPTREGYIFKGWFLGETEYDFTKPVEKGFTLTAKWEVIPAKYTITYTDGVDGKVIFADKVFENVVDGSDTPAFGDAPTRSGYTFKGWSPAVAEKVTGNQTYTATWQKRSSGGSYGGGSYVAPDKDADNKLRIVMQINNKNILVNGKTMVNDVAPVIVADRTLVPIRVVTELLGGTADWNDDTRTVTLKIDGKVLSMTIGKPIPGFGTSAVIMNDRTYVPVRYVMEKLGAEVEWIGATQQIIIEK